MRFYTVAASLLAILLCVVAPGQAIPTPQVPAGESLSPVNFTPSPATSGVSAKPVSFIPVGNSGSPVQPNSAPAAPAESSVTAPVSFIPVGSSGSPISARALSGAEGLQHRELEQVLARMINEKRTTENEVIGLMLFARSPDADN